MVSNQLKAWKGFVRMLLIIIGTGILCMIIGMHVAAFLYEDVEIHYLWNVIPICIVYNVDFLGEEREGVSSIMLILSKHPKRQYRDVIIEHEMIHCKQLFRTLLTHVILYPFSEKYRAKAEAEAYAIEIRSDSDIDSYAEHIQEFYSPGLKKEVIKNYLERYWFEKINRN
jgi:hypothetical protein